MKPSFSFIVVNFKSAQLLSPWFTSLQNTHLQPHEYEVIIINNDPSEQDIVEKFYKTSQFQCKTFHIIHSKNNIGFGAACNLGAQKAQGNILAFINPDAQFSKGNIRDIRKQLHKNSKVSAIGARLVSKNGKTQEWSAGVEITLLDILRNNLNFPASKKFWESKHTVSVDWVSGAAFFILKKTFMQVGCFDENFFLYFEDIDLCQRINIQFPEKHILYYPHITVKHLSGQSSTSQKQQKKYYYQSQDRYFAKHRPKWEGFCLRILRYFAR